MSYWCAEQLVVTVEGPAGRSVVSLAQPFARVGSHPSADVVIPDQAVAPRCLYLHGTPNGVFCLFLDSESPDPDQKGVWLSPEQALPIGVYRVWASVLTAEAGDSVPSQSLVAWGSAPPPLPVMLVYCGAVLKDKRRFRARLNAVGRRPQCALQLKGEMVSGFHCVLYWERQQLWCIDLCSGNGTLLNSQPVNCSPVAVGDRLQIGEFGLVFQRLSRGGSRAATAAQLESAESANSAQAERDSQQLETSLSPPVAAPAMVKQPSSRWRLPTTETKPAASPPDEPVAALPAELQSLPGVALERPPIAGVQLNVVDKRQLRDELAEEVARLAREREETQARWEQASQQLTAQAARLNDQATQLAADRQALELARRQWHEEQATLQSQLAERASQLARLESELTTTSSALAQKLAEIDRQSLLPHSPSPDPQHELLAQWEAASRQLTVQAEQLQAESARLAAERGALDQSRNQWQTDRDALTQQLGERSEQLARLEAQLAASAESLARKLADLEQQSPPTTVPVVHQVAAETVPPSIDESPVALKEVESSTACRVDLDAQPPAGEPLATGGTPQSSAPAAAISPISSPEPIPLSPPAAVPAFYPAVAVTSSDGSTRVAFADRDELPVFVSDRLVARDTAERRRQLLLWLAGGAGFAVVVTLVVVVLLWVL